MGIINFTGFEEGEINYFGGYPGTFVTPVCQTSIVHTGTYAAQTNPIGTQVSHFKLGLPPQAFNLTNANGAYTQTYFYIGTLPAATEEVFMVFGGSSEIQFRITSTGITKIYNWSSSTLLATGTTVLATGQWYKLDVDYNDVTPTLKLRINGIQEFNISLSSPLMGISSQLGFEWGKVRDTNGNTVNFYYDDIVISDGVLIKDYQAAMAVPTSAGTYTSWAGNFQKVNEIPPDNNTTTVSASGTAAQYETFNTGAFGNVMSYDAVKIISKLSASSTRTDIVLRAVSGTTNNDFNIQNIGPVGFVYYDDVLNTDPATSGAWSQTSANALQVGIGFAGGAGADIGSVAATVIYKYLLYSNTYVATGGVIVYGYNSNHVISSPVITGGVVVSGAASTRLIAEVQLTPSGVICSGSAVLQVVYNASPSSGVVAGGLALAPAIYSVTGDTTPPSALASGSAVFSVAYNPAPSGEVLVGGLGLLNWYYTGSGGALASGVSSILVTYSTAASGGAIASGSATALVTYLPVPRSGAIVGGAAIVPSTYNFTATGGVVCGGHPLENTSFTASGGAVAGGSTPAIVLYAVSPSGGVVTGGANNYSGVANYIASGSALVSGIALTTAVYATTSSGGVIAGGHGTTVFNIVASGEVVCGGVAGIATAISVSGGIVVSGLAIVESITSTRRYTCLANGQVGVDARFLHPTPIPARRKYERVQDINGAFLPAVTVCELIRENRINNFN